MITNKKLKAIFNRWLVDNYWSANSDSTPDKYVRAFYKTAEPYQWGVYQKFYAEQFIFIVAVRCLPISEGEYYGGLSAVEDLQGSLDDHRDVVFQNLDSIEEAWTKVLECAENLFIELKRG